MNEGCSKARLQRSTTQLPLPHSAAKSKQISCARRNRDLCDYHFSSQAPQRHIGIEGGPHHAGEVGPGRQSIHIRLVGCNDSTADHIGVALRNLVVEWITKSAPSTIGRCSAGDRNVLSTATLAPAALARAAIARISNMRNSGLLGVSISTSEEELSKAADSAASSF